jgi:WD40 repeat protein
LAGHASDITSCVFTPDGSKVITGSADNTLRLWDLPTGETVHQFDGHTDDVFTCDISPDGVFAVSAGGDKTLRIWDLETGAERLILLGHTNDIWGCAVSPDSQYVVSASWDNTIRVWSTSSGQGLATLVLPGMLQCIALFPRGDRLITGDASGAVHLIELLGFDLAPPIITAVKRNGQADLRCPACSSVVGFKQEWLGKEITCPAHSCESHLRVNPFVADSALARRIDDGK